MIKNFFVYITSHDFLILYWKFVPFDQLHPFRYLQSTPASVNHQSVLYELGFLFSLFLYSTYK